MKMSDTMRATLKAIVREGPVDRWPNNPSLSALERRGLVTKTQSKSAPHLAMWTATDAGAAAVARV